MLDFTANPVVVHDGQGQGTATGTNQGQSATFEVQQPGHNGVNRPVRVEVGTYSHEALLDLDQDKQYRVRIEEVP